MAQLAIKEHPTRGKEVIEILEMLGGKNLNNLDGASNMYYLIGLIVPTILAAGKLELDKSHEQFTYFTLEEFEKKFPYKIGDKVCYQPNLQIDTICISEIISMKWADNSVIYFTSNGHSLHACDLQHYKKETIEEIIKIDMPKGYEFDGIDDDNQQVVFEKIGYQYPKTYEECCEVLNLGEDGNLYTKGHQASLIQDFHKLFICRAAYWKIAGEQMGLGKPWKPDWNNVSDKHCIYFVSGEIWLTECQTRQCTLAFPTAEMRDAFYENFKELIDKCKELL